MYCQYQRKQIFWNDSIFFFEIHYWEIERTRQMTDQEDNINLGKNVFDDRNPEKKSRACWGQTCSRFLIVFVPDLKLCCLSLVAFGKLIIQKLVMNPRFVWKFCVMQQDTFYTHRNYEQVNF